jgi:4-hydroxy-4-methyl-2-oxoglutarate aldolase
VTARELIDRLLDVEVSTICDADKGLPVVDPQVHAMVPDVRMAGPALTVVAADDHLPVFSALAEAEPGAVLVVATAERSGDDRAARGSGRRAVCGELFATEAKRRGLAGVVIDGLCRDHAGLRRNRLPFFARGTTPMAGTVKSRTALGARVRCGGVDVSSGDIVFADDDGVVIAPAARLEAALQTAEEIARAERAILKALARGERLHDLTNYAEHVARLDEGEESSLAFLA